MKEYFVIRKINEDEMDLLEDIIIDALSVWKYSESELQGLRKRLEISPELVQKSVIYVVELRNEIIGFWLQEIRNDLSENRFYIKQIYIKKGIGKALWEKVSKLLKTDFGLEYITFISDANAQEFYEKMGAVKIDEKPSVVLIGESVPIMRYNLK